MFKNETKIEKAFANTVSGMESELNKETSFGEEEVNPQLFTVKIPPPPPHKKVWTDEERAAYKKMLQERTQSAIESIGMEFQQRRKETIDNIKRTIKSNIELDFNEIENSNNTYSHIKNFRVTYCSDDKYCWFIERQTIICKLIDEINSQKIYPLDINYQKGYVNNYNGKIDPYVMTWFDLN